MKRAKAAGIAAGQIDRAAIALVRGLRHYGLTATGHALEIHRAHLSIPDANAGGDVGKRLVIEAIDPVEICLDVERAKIAALGRTGGRARRSAIGIAQLGDDGPEISRLAVDIDPCSFFLPRNGDGISS